jgi:hypothetical protein
METIYVGLFDSDHAQVEYGSFGVTFSQGLITRIPQAPMGS